MKSWAKQWIINLLLSKVIRVSIPQDVFTYNSKTGQVKLGGVLLTQPEVNSLNSEAKTFKSMRLWSVINETMKDQCFARGWRDSTTIEHLNTAKTMYSVLETQQSIVKSFEDMIK